MLCPHDATVLCEPEKQRLHSCWFPSLIILYLHEKVKKISFKIIVKQAILLLKLMETGMNAPRFIFLRVITCDQGHY